MRFCISLWWYLVVILVLVACLFIWSLVLKIFQFNCLCSIFVNLSHSLLSAIFPSSNQCTTVHFNIWNHIVAQIFAKLWKVGKISLKGVFGIVCLRVLLCISVSKNQLDLILDHNSVPCNLSLVISKAKSQISFWSNLVVNCGDFRLHNYAYMSISNCDCLL